MPHLRILTGGESHGASLIGIIDGIPAGLSLVAEQDINPILSERQKGYGRSYRQKIESDRAQILSGVRFGMTTGAPIALHIENNDWKNWSDKMSVTSIDKDREAVTIPRPGHADLAGAIKYGHMDDLRNVFERASARETAMRVAIGAICSKLLFEIGVVSVSFVKSIGTIEVNTSNTPSTVEELKNKISNSEVRMCDADATTRAIELIEEAKRQGDTLGGIVQAEFYNVPVGIGSHVQWDRKLDANIAQAVVSIQAVKAVEFGDGLNVASQRGSESHDEIRLDNKRITRTTNHAGGIEGGMSNGMPIIVRAAMKPISTLMQPLRSIDLVTSEQTNAHIERSDVCAVPSLSIIVERVVATVLADNVLDTFGGDTMTELQERVTKRRSQEMISK
ncbi:MAG TPA: chorismate synthase [Candidatus Kapabacteria bacterium]|nr:chorismate synthase [Candidatus Kapabacteria bacterium]